jgi:hypothetical protein
MSIIAAIPPRVVVGLNLCASVHLIASCVAFPGMTEFSDRAASELPTHVSFLRSRGERLRDARHLRHDI